jgi:hypothetical protein
VRILIEQTPAPALPIRIDSESVDPEAPLPRTDEDGIASQSVLSSDTVTISSALAVIRFTPISGGGSALANSSPIDINAERLIEPSPACRRSVVAQEDEVVFPFINVSDELQEIDNAIPLNIVLRGEDNPTTTQSPSEFALGSGFFTVPVTEFSISDSLISGGWNFLGARRVFSFNPLIEDSPLPLCEGKGLLPCNAFSDVGSQKLLRVTTKYIEKLLILEKRLKKMYPEKNKNFSFRRDRSRSYEKIKAITSTLRNESLECADDKTNCRQGEVPKARLEKIFFSAFRPRPPTGRGLMRSLRAKGQRDLRTILNQLPDFVVTCD